VAAVGHNWRQCEAISTPGIASLLSKDIGDGSTMMDAEQDQHQDGHDGARRELPGPRPRGPADVIEFAARYLITLGRARFTIQSNWAGSAGRSRSSHLSENG
jgi:hypothetical protein